MFIDFLTLMLTNLVVALVLFALFIGRLIDKEPKKVVPGFLLTGFIALITGFRMIFTWPLPGPYNFPYGEMTIFYGGFFFMAGTCHRLRLGPHHHRNLFLLRGNRHRDHRRAHPQLESDQRAAPCRRGVRPHGTFVHPHPPGAVLQKSTVAADHPGRAAAGLRGDLGIHRVRRLLAALRCVCKVDAGHNEIAGPFRPALRVLEGHAPLVFLHDGGVRGAGHPGRGKAQSDRLGARRPDAGGHPLPARRDEPRKRLLRLCGRDRPARLPGGPLTPPSPRREDSCAGADARRGRSFLGCRHFHRDWSGDHAGMASHCAHRRWRACGVFLLRRSVAPERKGPWRADRLPDVGSAHGARRIFRPDHDSESFTASLGAVRCPGPLGRTGPSFQQHQG